MFGPLNFPTPEETFYDYNAEIGKSFSCIVCDDQFCIDYQQNIIFYEHLFSEHNIIIKDVERIASLYRYTEFWREKLKDVNLNEEFRDYFVKKSDLNTRNLLNYFYCEHVKDDYSSKNETNSVALKNGQYLILSERIPEDRELRNKLHLERLEFMLEQQRREREIEDYTRECLLCRTVITGTLAKYLTHLNDKHHLSFGLPDNLVFIDEFINKIEQKFVNLHCLYCNNLFKNREVMKEHMRKKFHKCLNPNNKEFDKFYMINYLEMGKTWRNLENVKDHLEETSDQNDDAEWEDWKENNSLLIVCLFCKTSLASWQDTLTHMIDEHDFDYSSLTVDLNHYQQVKLVNYIRRQMHLACCVKCDYNAKEDNDDKELREKLMDHMRENQHLSLLPDQVLWDQPEYFFSTYENDLFLSNIDASSPDNSYSAVVESSL